jgi:hypothetical protein
MAKPISPPNPVTISNRPCELIRAAKTNDDTFVIGLKSSHDLTITQSMINKSGPLRVRTTKEGEGGTPLYVACPQSDLVPKETWREQTLRPSRIPIFRTLSNKLSFQNQSIASQKIFGIVLPRTITRKFHDRNIRSRPHGGMRKTQDRS